MNLDLITLDAIYRISLQNKQFLFVIENNMCLMIIYFIFIGILIEKKIVLHILALKNISKHFFNVIMLP